MFLLTFFITNGGWKVVIDFHINPPLTLLYCLQKKVAMFFTILTLLRNFIEPKEELGQRFKPYIGKIKIHLFMQALKSEQCLLALGIGEKMS